jgi:copper chaperone CopZ
MKTQKYKINGMHCTSCAMNIDFELEDLQGVHKTQTSYVKQICEIEFDEHHVTEKNILDAIGKVGYSASRIQ